jgi:hypothetical protein
MSQNMTEKTHISKRIGKGGMIYTEKKCIGNSLGHPVKKKCDKTQDGES